MEMRRFVKSSRKEMGLTGANVCAGMCSESQYRNYENGHRDLNIFVQKRIMDRLGCSSIGLQCLLKNKEYECWQICMEILFALMEGDMVFASQRMKKFQEIWGRESVHRQFLERMNAFYALLHDDDRKEALNHIEKALACTVPGYQNIRQLDQLLSAGEWDLLLDFCCLQESPKPADFRHMLERIGDSPIENQEKSRVYPKAVLCLIEISKKQEEMGAWKLEDLVESDRLSGQALSYLRKYKNGIFLPEILQIRHEILTWLCKKESAGSGYQEELKKTEVWLKALELCPQKHETGKELLLNFQVYMMRNVESLCDVLTKRMDMLALTEEELAGELHIDARTIISIRKEKHTPQKQVAEELLAKLGLPQRYLQQIFFVENKKEKEAVDRLVENEKYGGSQDAEALLNELKDSAKSELAVNARGLKWHQIWADYGANRITAEEGAEKVKELIEECFLWEALEDGKRGYYFSYEELQLLCGFLILGSPESLDFKLVLRRLEQECRAMMHTFEELNDASILGMILDAVQSAYGNTGEFSLSNQYCKDIIRISERYGNLFRVEDALYALWWNRKEQSGKEDKETLSALADLANLIGDVQGEELMRKQLPK